MPSQILDELLRVRDFGQNRGGDLAGIGASQIAGTAKESDGISAAVNILSKIAEMAEETADGLMGAHPNDVATLHPAGSLHALHAVIRRLDKAVTRINQVL